MYEDDVKQFKILSTAATCLGTVVLTCICVTLPYYKNSLDYANLQMQAEYSEIMVIFSFFFMSIHKRSRSLTCQTKTLTNQIN